MGLYLAIFVVASLFYATNAYSDYDISFDGFVGTSYRYYPESGMYSGQIGDSHWDLIFSPKIILSTEENYSFVFEGFSRMENLETYRNHSDVRQFYLLKTHGNYDFTVGIIKEFWGVAESKNIVNIVNQVDFSEGIDEKERLGQLAMALTRITNFGSLGIYWFPEFEARDYPDKFARFQFPKSIDSSVSSFDVNNRKGREFAIRYSGSFNELDIGLHTFFGINREPIFVENEDSSSLIAHYPDAEQFGLDLQYTRDAWLLKLEMIINNNHYEDYNALVSGFEYTFFQLFKSSHDLGIVFEYLFSEKDKYFQDPLSDDVFYGIRYAFNGLSSATFLAGVVEDLDTGGKQAKLEFSSRLNNQIQLKLDSVFISDDDELYPFRNDSFLELTFEWYL